jgi:hypothetical protein
MELRQMDVVAGVKIEPCTECSVVTGLDDHSRFCISAKVVARATATPVSDAFSEAMRCHGMPSSTGSNLSGRPASRNLGAACRRVGTSMRKLQRRESLVEGAKSGTRLSSAMRS